MQKIKMPESNLTRKWWCMNQEAIPKMEKAVQKMMAHASSEAILGTSKLSSQKRMDKLYISYNVLENMSKLKLKCHLVFF